MTSFRVGSFSEILRYPTTLKLACFRPSVSGSVRAGAAGERGKNEHADSVSQNT